MRARQDLASRTLSALFVPHLLMSKLNQNPLMVPLQSLFSSLELHSLHPAKLRQVRAPNSRYLNLFGSGYPWQCRLPHLVG